MPYGFLLTGRFAINNWLSVTNDYDCISAMLLGSSRNGRLEVTPFSVPTTSGSVCVIRRDAKSNMSGLTAPGSLNPCPMPTKLLWYTHGASKFRSLSERPSNFRVKA